MRVAGKTYAGKTYYVKLTTEMAHARTRQCCGGNRRAFAMSEADAPAGLKDIDIIGP